MDERKGQKGNELIRIPWAHQSAGPATVHKIITKKIPFLNSQLYYIIIIS